MAFIAMLHIFKIQTRDSINELNAMAISYFADAMVCQNCLSGSLDLQFSTKLVQPFFWVQVIEGSVHEQC